MLAIERRQQGGTASAIAPPTVRARYRFFLDSNIEVPAVTEFQMYELERICSEETGPDLLHAVESGGLALALLAMELLGERKKKARIVVLAGRGPGGEAGIFAARHLAKQHGRVKLCLSNPPFAGQSLSYQHLKYSLAGAPELQMWNLHSETPDLIIDALLDYRCSSKPRGNVAGLINWANGTGAPILSYDIPSGLNSNTGVVHGTFIRPQWTLTPTLPKAGLIPDLTGKLFLADAGIRSEAFQRAGIPFISPFGNKLWAPLKGVADNIGLDW